MKRFLAATLLSIASVSNIEPEEPQTEDKWLQDLTKQIRVNLQRCESHPLNEYCSVEVRYIQHRKVGKKKEILMAFSL